jgi:hypothetical protein
MLTREPVHDTGLEILLLPDTPYASTFLSHPAMTEAIEGLWRSGVPIPLPPSSLLQRSLAYLDSFCTPRFVPCFPLFSSPF